jgi:hypothetical protein
LERREKSPQKEEVTEKTPSSSSSAAPPTRREKEQPPPRTPKLAQPLYQPRYQAQSPYSVIKGSRLAQLIESGSISVVRASYFEDCEMRNLPFGRRQDISSMFMWPGNVAVQQWAEHGKCFLCNVSYCWLSKQHPDPEQYHLKKLTKIFSEFKKLWDMQDFGVILDFCSLWQPDGEKDNRSEEQLNAYQKSLEEVNTSFGHRSVTTFILTGVPPTEEKQYNDRGWTLLETSMIDSKGGDWNRWRFSHFDTSGTWANPYTFFNEARLDGRKVPFRPEDFDLALELRRKTCEEKDSQLFSRSIDNERVPKLFRSAFQHLTRETKLVYDGVSWADDDISQLVLLLPYYENLEQLHLRNNKIGPLGANRLAEVVPKMKHLQTLVLTGNPLCRDFTVRTYLSAVWAKATKPLRMLEF